MNVKNAALAVRQILLNKPLHKKHLLSALHKKRLSAHQQDQNIKECKTMESAWKQVKVVLPTTLSITIATNVSVLHKNRGNLSLIQNQSRNQSPNQNENVAR